MRGWLSRLEGNPATAYKFHRFMSRFWMANIVIVVAIYFVLPKVWSNASILYLALISIYANYSTDAGAMSAADSATDEAITKFAIDADDQDSGPWPPGS
jgi:hypothetical protein